MSKSLALYAFHCLISDLASTPPKTLVGFEEETKSKTGDYPQKAPLFVTWSKNGDLRGCIGTFQSMPVENGVAEYALISAFEDTRFRPIIEAELSQLSASITLLGNYVQIDDPLDWKVGKNGLKVKFTDANRQYSGTFLPSVAEEQEWDHTETLWHLLKKGGFNRVPIQKALEYYTSNIAAGRLELIKYDGLKCAATYKEFVDFTQKQNSWSR